LSPADACADELTRPELPAANATRDWKRSVMQSCPWRSYGVRFSLLLSLSTALILVSDLVSPSGVVAGAMTKNVESVRPRIGQCGTSVEVRIQGISLGDPRGIVFYRPGIRAVEIRTSPEPPHRRGFAHGGQISEEVRCTFEIDPDCPLGEHPFRLLTATELTCIGTFHVSPFPVMEEGETNNAYSNDSIETATPVALNVTVCGHLGNGSRPDRDLYRLTGKAGQRLSVEVESARIADQHYGDSEFDLAMRILDESGRVIAANDDNPLHLQDPVASVKLPHDGAVFVEVRRSIFVPSETVYCVHIGNHRRPLAAFPPGGPSGSRQTIRLLGDPLGESDEELQIPEARGTFEFHGGDAQPQRAPTALKLRSSPFPNVLEESAAEVTGVSQYPVALNGIIDSVGDVDGYRFTARKGERRHVRVFAASLGSPIDPLIRIRPIGPDGQPGPAELETDDSPVTDHDIFGTSFRGGGGLQEAIDPSVIWEPKSDGEYVLEITDPSGAGGPTGVYRIEMEPPRVVVQTLLASGTFDWTESTRVTGLAIPRGNRWTVDLSLPTGQWNAIPCEYELIAHGLPQGVSFVSPLIKPGTSRWPIQFVAGTSASPGGAVITLEARPVDPNQTVETRCQQNVPFINHPGGSAWRTVRTDRYVMGVTDPAPFSIDIEQPSVALVRGGELTVPVRITRHNGFDGAVEFRCGSVPRSITTPPPTIIPAGQNEGVLQLGAESNAPLEALPLYVIGSTIRDDISDFLGAGHVRVSSALVNLSVSQPYVEFAAQPESIRRGERKRLTWTVRQHTPFTGEASVKLLGLPKGVRVIEPSPTFTTAAESVAFELEATDDALLGQVTGLICEVMIPTGDQQIVQRTGQGTLRIDPALN